EIAGVHTGKIFGEYSYGEVLGYKLYGVPLIIGFNWLFVILGAFSICNYFSKNNFIVVFFTAVLATVFDYLLEPVAMDLGYWNWANIIIPFQNYLAWFIISFLLSLSLIYFRLKISSEIYIHFFTAQLIFFLFLNFR
ncbi:MAG TPA: carotenoid biosynthesis protein, partial [Ignavibacteria bacterium]|nr:carotenoid biosynthesis protein [Ignavibacteria bacterium]